MLGAIIGDIVGSRFEFRNNTTDKDFELFTRQNSYTDDTICTIAVADAITGGKSYKDSLLEWCRRYPHPMGAYGGGFARWIRSERPEPYNSFGNGSAMRVSPVAWAFDSLKDVLGEAAKTAEVTHNHPEGIKGAQTVAHAIWLLRRAKDMAAFANLIEAAYQGFRREYPAGVFDETCQGTVPVACKIICEASGFEDAIRRAILQGGDSDTIGAIVGGIAEAAFGIPSGIRDKALDYLPEEMIRVITIFAKNVEIRSKRR